MSPLPSLFAPARVPAESASLLILLHGLGSNEQDLFSFAPELDSRLSIAALRAPFEYSYGGYAWFDVAWTESTVEIDASQAISSLEVLAQAIRDLQVEHSVSASQTLLGGFSQGSMMSLGILLRKPELIGGAMLLSGSLVPEFMGEERTVHQPVFQCHGILDPVLPIHIGRQVKALLESRHAPLDYHEYPMGHEVTYPCLRATAKWLTQYLDKQKGPGQGPGPGSVD